jgi:hypothetical protein
VWSQGAPGGGSRAQLAETTWSVDWTPSTSAASPSACRRPRLPARSLVTSSSTAAPPATCSARPEGRPKPPRAPACPASARITTSTSCSCWRVALALAMLLWIEGRGAGSLQWVVCRLGSSEQRWGALRKRSTGRRRLGGAEGTAAQRREESRREWRLAASRGGARRHLGDRDTAVSR